MPTMWKTREEAIQESEQFLRRARVAEREVSRITNQAKQINVYVFKLMTENENLKKELKELKEKYKVKDEPPVTEIVSV